MRLPPNSSRFHRLPAVPWVLGFAAALMMLVGQSAAVGAVPSGGGTWIEICGAGGTRLVQTEGESRSTSCDHCEFCTVQFSSPSDGAPAFPLIGSAPSHTPVQYYAVRTVVVPCAEQYWAANRGPPLASEETMNTNFADLAVMTSPASRGVSCL